MRVLIIDNGTCYLSQLKNLLFDHVFQVIEYSKIDSVDSGDFDTAVLSGGHDFPVYGNDARLKKEIDFVKNFPKSIFGICFGFEIIASVFGAKLELMQNKEQGILDIQIVDPAEIFLKTSSFQVFESHRWVVKEPTDELVVLARSKDGIEAVKHKTRPIYAVQFHPEMFIEKFYGDEIFCNFFRIVSGIVSNF